MAPKAPAREKRATALDNALRGMFKKLEARPVPDHISTIVDQLDAAEDDKSRKKVG